MSLYGDEVRAKNLPYEKPITTTRPQLIIILIVVIGGFVIGNQIINMFLVPFSSNITNKYHVIRNLTQPVDVVILGDSTADRGINPAMIKEETGLSVINLSTVGRWAYHGDLFVLKWYIEKFGAPKLIILSHTYDANRRETEDSQIILDSTVPLTAWNSDYLTISLRPSEIIANTMAAIFPTIYRDISTKTLIDYYVFGIDTQDKVVPNGFVALTEELPKANVEMNVNRHKRIINNRTSKFTSFTKAGRDALIKLINDYQIPTYVAITPLLDEIANMDNLDAYLETQRNFWNQLAVENENWHYDPEVIAVERQITTDARHLNKVGSIIYTEHLIDWIWGDHQRPPIAQ